MKEIVIKISDEFYEKLMDRTKYIHVHTMLTLGDAVRNGKVLPKGHGRLIDADNIPIDTFFDEWDIPNAETLVEADKEEE